MPIILAAILLGVLVGWEITSSSRKTRRELNAILARVEKGIKLWN